jgi:hypothetical protein
MTNDAARQTFRRSALVGALPSLVIFSWLLTHGTFDFVSSGFSSNFYDIQAISLLHGHLSMPASVLSVEGMAHQGRSYMYFGPALSIVRMPIMAVAPQLAGKLSDLSMVAAFVVALGATTAFLFRARTLLRPSAGDVSRFEAVTVAVTVFCVGTGTVVLYLASFSSVYQETELWAIALVIVGAVLFLDVVRRPTKGRSVVFGVVVLAAFMTRVSVGSALVVMAVALAVAHCAIAYARAKKRSDPSWLTPLGLSLEGSSRPIPVLFGIIVLIPLALYVLINVAKFGTPLIPPLGHQQIVTTSLVSTAYKQVALKNPSFTGLQYLPTTISWYLRPDALSLSTLFPFVNFPDAVRVIGGTKFAELAPTSSVTATMPAPSPCLRLPARRASSLLAAS